MKRIARRIKRQTLLRFDAADQARLAALSKRTGLSMAEVVARALYRAFPGERSAETRKYLALVRQITAAPPGATAQQRADLEAHRMVGQYLICRAAGVPELLTWNRWLTTANNLRRRAGETAAKRPSVAKRAGNGTADLTYEENLALMEQQNQAAKPSGARPRPPRRSVKLSATRPVVPASSPSPAIASAPAPAVAVEPDTEPTIPPSPALARRPGPAESTESGGAVEQRAPILSGDTMAEWPIASAQRAARDGRARWLND
ncbi:MAG: hypothetical protein ACYDAB_08180 [bacterium]